MKASLRASYTCPLHYTGHTLQAIFQPAAMTALCPNSEAAQPTFCSNTSFIRVELFTAVTLVVHAGKLQRAVRLAIALLVHIRMVFFSSIVKGEQL